MKTVESTERQEADTPPGPKSPRTRHVSILPGDHLSPDYIPFPEHCVMTGCGKMVFAFIVYGFAIYIIFCDQLIWMASIPAHGFFLF